MNHVFPNNLPLPEQPNPYGLNPWPGVLANLTHYANGNLPIYWSVSGAMYEAYMESPVFDIRAEWTPGEQVQGAGVGILGVGTLGLNRYLAVMVRGAPEAAVPLSPASVVGLKIYSTQVCALVRTQDLVKLPEIDNTTELQAGGRQVAAVNSPMGGSLLQFCVPAGVRFWKLSLRFTFPVASGDPPALRIDLASN